jgi:hypothetical protein
MIDRKPTAELINRAVSIAEKLSRRSPDSIGPDDVLSWGDGQFVAALIYDFVNDALVRANKSRKGRRPKNADRDFFVAMDFRLRGAIPNRAKLVAQAWKMKASAVANIASRWGKKCKRQWDARPDRKFWTGAVAMYRSRHIISRPNSGME